MGVLRRAPLIAVMLLGAALLGCSEAENEPSPGNTRADATVERPTPTVERPAPTRRRSVTVRRTRSLGRSSEGRRLRVVEIGNPSSKRRILVVGCIHGTECAGTAVARRLLRGAAPREALLWIVPNLNPDGRAAETRLNGRGVDLNRNFPSEWRPFQRRGEPQYSGPRPLSEPESRAFARFVRARRPSVTIVFHQPQAVVRAWGQSVRVAQHYARLAGVPFRRIRWPHGTASNWQNHRFPGTSSFVVELAAGELGHAAAQRHASAVLGLASAGGD